MFPLTRDGFLTKYLVAGRVDGPIEDATRDSNQLRYEKHLRAAAPRPARDGGSRLRVEL